MNRLENLSTYPIREFARLTGVNPVTLRAWERRYGIIQPMRTEKGHRFYTDTHVERVNNILYWLEKGYPVRQVKLLLSDSVPTIPANNDDWQQQQNAMLTAVTHLNSQKLDELWNSGLASYPMAVYYERCLLPVLEVLRADYSQPLLVRAFEHMLARKLTGLIQSQHRHNDGPTLLMATNHADAELNLLASSYALGAAAFRVEYFGHCLTPTDIQIASQIVSSSWVWVHFHPSNNDQVQPWIDFAQQHERTVFVSGAVPAALSASEKTVRLPEQTAKQVQMFITTLGGQA